MIGAIAAANGIMGAASSIYGAKKSADTAKKINEQQLAYSKEAAQNAHQWEVADLKAAGLNPILSAGGNGANASGITPQIGDYSGFSSAGNQLGDAITKAVAAEQSVAQSQKTQAETSYIAGPQSGKTNKEIKEIKERTKVHSAQAAMLNSQTNLNLAEVGLNSSKKALLQSQAEEANARKWKANQESQKIAEERDRIRGGKAAETIGTDAYNEMKGKIKYGKNYKYNRY